MMKKWFKRGLWGGAILIAFIFFMALLQEIGILPSSEEIQATQTFRAETEVAQAITETRIALDVNRTQAAQTQIAELIRQTEEVETATALASITPTLTATPTLSETPTNTFTPTMTFTPSATFTPSRTPPPSATPDPEDLLAELVEDEVTGELRSVQIAHGLEQVFADWKMTDNFLGSDKDYTGREMLHVTCKIKEAGIGVGYQVVLSAWIDVIDRFGNESTIIGMSAKLNWDTVERINCGNVDLLAIDNIADELNVHDLVD